MLCANSAAESLRSPYTNDHGLPHSFLIRIYGSFAAPIFVFLAGFMVGIGTEKHPPVYFLKRALEILVVAALIDFFIWRIIPGTTFDVLYLTAFGIFITSLLLRANVSVRVIAMLICFALGPILQHFFGYREGVDEFQRFPTADAPNPVVSGTAWWFRSWLIDGWFPVFPWLGFTIAGSLVYSHGAFFSTKWKMFFPLGILFFLGGITWLYFHRPIADREGYSELFYPPGIAYLCAASGAITIGVTMMQFLHPKKGLQLLRYLGSCSLFIYITHSAIIAFVLDNYFTDYPLPKFLLLYACFAAAMIFLAWVLFVLKHKPSWKKVPKPVRFIFGG